MESQFECTECGETFENKTSLGNHTRNHKSFSCPEASCEYVAKRKDQLKVHVTSKHPGSEYATQEKPLKRKSDETPLSESINAQPSTAYELGSLLSSSEEAAPSSKRSKIEPTEVTSDNSVVNAFTFDNPFFKLLQGTSDVHQTEQPHASSVLDAHSHVSAQPIGSPSQSVFSLDMLAPLQLNKENVRLDGRMASEKGKSMRSLVEQIGTLGNQIDVLTDLRNRLISELSAKALPSDGQ